MKNWEDDRPVNEEELTHSRGKWRLRQQRSALESNMSAAGKQLKE